MTWQELFRSPSALARVVVSVALSVTVATLVVLALVGFVTSQRLASDAIHSRDSTAVRASARVTDLTARNDVLQAEIDTSTETAATLRQQLADKKETP